MRQLPAQVFIFQYIYLVQAARYIRFKLIIKKDGHFHFAHTGSPLSILTGFFKITGADGEGFSTGAFETTPGDEERMAEAQGTSGEDVEESSALTKETS